MRSGFVEGHHRGDLVAVDPGGQVLLCRGGPERAMFPRSANKPLQAVGMLRAGLAAVLDRARPPDDPAELLALTASSHSGEPRHLLLATTLLGLAELTPAALACPPALPLGEEARATWLRDGGGPDPLCRDCSGKHAGMLATCVGAGWPTTGYLDPDHPVQRACRAAVEDLTGDAVTATGIDGCGAPLFAVSLTGLARAFSRMVTAEPGTPERRVADAMRQWPGVVGGAVRPVTDLMRAVPGLLVKDGAEAVLAAAVGTGPLAGTGLAVKVDDGGARATAPVLVAALRYLGVDAPGLEPLAETPLLGGGVPVGAVRPVPLD